MMNDLAMHILELLMNSIQANCKHLLLVISDSLKDNLIDIYLEDDGQGMDDAQLKKALDPFTTSRTTRKVGMGLAFAKGLSELCNGTINIDSQKGIGTKIDLKLQKDHIDLPPWGDLGEMIMMAIQSNEQLSLVFTYKTDISQFDFDTKIIKEQLNGVSILEPDVLLWIKDYINQNINKMMEELK